MVWRFCWHLGATKVYVCVLCQFMGVLDNVVNVTKHLFCGTPQDFNMEHALIVLECLLFGSSGQRRRGAPGCFRQTAMGMGSKPSHLQSASIPCSKISWKLPVLQLQNMPIMAPQFSVNGTCKCLQYQFTLQECRVSGSTPSWRSLLLEGINSTGFMSVPMQRLRKILGCSRTMNPSKNSLISNMTKGKDVFCWERVYWLPLNPFAPCCCTCIWQSQGQWFKGLSWFLAGWHIGIQSIWLLWFWELEQWAMWRQHVGGVWLCYVCQRFESCLDKRSIIGCEPCFGWVVLWV